MHPREILDAALAIHDPAQRSAYLDQACAGNVALRDHVAGLLQLEGQLGSFLESPVVERPQAGAARGSPTLAEEVETPGTMVGPYKLLEQIGEGGFGVVYMAEQTEPVRRKVALKILKAGMDTKQVIARFEAERQALAIMDHPNIAKVFDGGMTGSNPKSESRNPKQIRSTKSQASSEARQEVSDIGASDFGFVSDFDIRGSDLAPGRPYFVMELVKGVPITEFCDQHHLTPKQRLELFIPVCQAVQHAHQKGIIHRDLKPSNVLVSRHDSTPVPKIIDFGIAKALGQELTDKTLFTGIAQMVGTPLYMSPEQAGMSDLDIDTRSDIYSLGVLLYELLTGTTPFDKDRFKQAAYDEIRRIIREEDPPKPSTRLSHLSSPHAPREEPGHVTRSVTATLAAVAAQRQTEPAKLTKLVRGELDWIVMKALEKDRNRRYETANGFAMDVQRYLADEPVQACPPSAGYRLRKFVRRNKGPVFAASLVLLALVAGIIGTSWGLVRADKARQDAVAAQRAEGERADGERRARNDAEKAAGAERKAKEAATTQRLRAEDNAKLAMAVLDEIIMKEARRRLTFVTQEEAQGFAKNPEREKLERELLEKGLTFYEKLAENNPTDWTARRQRAKAYANVGLLRLELKNHVESEKAYRQAIHLMEELAGERPRDFNNAYDLANTFQWFFRPYMDTGRLQPAEEITRQALALFEKLAADFPERQSPAQEGSGHCKRNLALVLEKTGKLKNAEKAYREALAIWSELATAHPKAASYRDALAYDYQLLANLYTGQKRYADADTAYKMAKAGLVKLVAELNDPEYRSRLGGILLRWAFCCRADGRFEEAERIFREAALEFEALQTNFPRKSGWAIHELGYIYLYLGDLLSGLGGREEDAEKAYRQSLVYHEKQLAQDPEKRDYQARLTWSLAGLAKLLRKIKRPMEASQLDAKWIELKKKLASSATSALEMNNLAWNLATHPNPDFQRGPLAVELAKKAVKLEPTQGSYWNTLGTAHFRAGNWHAAIEALRKASELYQARFFSHDAFFLAMAHWQLGEKERARKWYAPALVWMEKHAPKNEELIGFRAEAASLLGLPEKLTPEQELAKADDVKFYALVLEADPKAAWAYIARGNAHIRLQQRDNALNDFSRAIELTPGQWKEAAADFAKAIELKKEDPLPRYWQALVRLHLGDVAEYRRLCADMLAQFGRSANAVESYWTLWTCVLAPDAMTDWQAVVQMGEKLLAADPKNCDKLQLLGAVLYRTGRFEDAAKRLAEAETAFPETKDARTSIIYNWLFQSMTEHRLGRTHKAKGWLEKAIKDIEQPPQDRSSDGAARVWNRQLTLQLLRREAENLLKKPAVNNHESEKKPN